MSTRNKAKAAEYRHSPKGILARKMYLLQPEVRLRMAIRRKAKRHIAGKT